MNSSPLPEACPSILLRKVSYIVCYAPRVTGAASEDAKGINRERPTSRIHRQNEKVVDEAEGTLAIAMRLDGYREDANVMVNFHSSPRQHLRSLDGH
jgi:hypothetical protein